MKKLFLISVMFTTPVAFAADAPWGNQCPDADILFCDHVGKTAFNATGTAVMKDIPLGKIEGVIFRPAGSLLGISEAIPDAGIPEQIRTAPEDGWYYIINDSQDTEPFLRWAREIQPR